MYSIYVWDSVVSVQPRSGYLIHAACLKGLKRLKGILNARLPPVIEVIPRLGYFIHAARLKGLKRLKGILATRLPPVIEIIPLSGVFHTRCMPKRAKKAKRHPCRSLTTGSLRSLCTTPKWVVYQVRGGLNVLE